MYLFLVYMLLCVYLFLSYRPNLVILSSHWNEDLHWLEKSIYPVIIYSKNPDSPHYTGQKNIGNEATAYLKYIIDNYDNLPNYVAFIHGHETAWHQGNILDLINRSKINEYDYISLNLHPIDRSESGHSVTNENISLLWDKYFKPYLYRDCPTRIVQDCCAQFIVSKNRILKHSKDAYVTWYNMFEIEEENLSSVKYQRSSASNLGAVFEFLWHIIFGEPDIEDINILESKFVQP